ASSASEYYTLSLHDALPICIVRFCANKFGLNEACRRPCTIGTSATPLASVAVAPRMWIGFKEKLSHNCKEKDDVDFPGAVCARMSNASHAGATIVTERLKKYRRLSDAI